MSRLILWDGCQEFSLYRHDLRLTSREGRDAAEEASSKLWRQRHTPPGASIRLITQEEQGKQHRRTLAHTTHMHINAHACTLDERLGIVRNILNMSTHPPLQMAYDGQTESLSKPQQLHSDVQR